MQSRLADLDSLPIWNAISASFSRLEDINAAESAREEREAARNNLESYITDAQDKLWQEEYEAASTDEQRTVIREMCSMVSRNFITSDFFLAT